jgi:negative regulator of genetic competence, sporulation and motility
MKRLASQQ